MTVNSSISTLSRRRKMLHCSSWPRSAATRKARRRRGAAAVLGLFLSTSLIVLMAMTLDLGYISVARSEMRRSADAAAMAACWQLFDERVKGTSDLELEQWIKSAASDLAARNTVCTQSPLLSDEYSDVQLGYFNSEYPDQFDTTDPSKFNAVRVNLRRQAEVNGKVPLFFARLLNRDGQTLQASSTAAMFSAIGGFYAPASSECNVDLLPLALDLETWDLMVAGGTPDAYRVENGVVQTGSDGIHECNLYPQGTGSPGNRGTVDIGGSNNSTADIARQILRGVSRQDFLEFGKPLEFNAEGRMYLNGDTGISAGVKDELASIVGQKRIIPIFETVSGNGNNATYTIVRFEGVRVLDVKLTGPMNQKRVLIQPCLTVARHAIVATSESVNTSTHVFTPVMLVQ